jgi:hypothetical protein
MSLKIYVPSPARKAERPNIVQRLAAILGLAGLVLAWAVVLLPCAVWLLCNLVIRRARPAPAIS